MLPDLYHAFGLWRDGEGTRGKTGNCHVPLDHAPEKRLSGRRPHKRVFWS